MEIILKGENPIHCLTNNNNKMLVGEEVDNYDLKDTSFKRSKF